MGRKKKKQSKPWCWYCNREFDDEKILIQHQKAKHFKCHICHKKLYTGPGLSIHCMQVHKETIDRVPNSLPNKGNIEIEIYGMEGIPPEDLREHEKNKGDDDEGPDSKRAKSDSPASVLTGTPPAGSLTPGMQPGSAIPGVQAAQLTGLPMAHGSLPGLSIPGLPRPPFGVPGMPWVVPGAAVPTAPPVVTYSGQPTGPNGQTNNRPPLFPSTSSSTSSGKPTFPAYGDESAPNGDKKPALIATTSATSKIIHPSEDVSLEERRARLPKYCRKPAPTSTAHVSASPAASASVAPGVIAAAQAAQAAMIPGHIMNSPQLAVGAPLVSVAAIPMISAPPTFPGNPLMVGATPMRPPQQPMMLRPPHHAVAAPAAAPIFGQPPAAAAPFGLPMMTAAAAPPFGMMGTIPRFR